MNSDPSSRKGQHWLAIYLDENKTGFFFDSYGNSPLSFDQAFVNFFSRNVVKFHYNSKKLQNDHSTVCGEFCLYFLILKARGHSMQYIVNALSFDFNDQYVYDYTPGIYADGYIAFAFPFVRSYVS